jgi:hypothetical protein
MNDKTPYTYDEALTTGYSIGKIITNIWNSFQKNPDLPLPGSYLELEKPYQTTTSLIKVNGSSLRKGE